MNIMGYQDHPISVRPSLQHGKRIGVVYPGFGYNLSCPVFFYLFQMLEMLEMDSYGVDLRYAETMKGISQEEGKKWLDHDSQAIGQHVKEGFRPTKKRFLSANHLAPTTSKTRFNKESSEKLTGLSG